MHLCLDGKIMDAGQPVLMADNKGYRYGDGLFETMKMVNGRVPLWEWHMRRFISGTAQLGFAMPSFFSEDRIFGEVTRLCEKNSCLPLARIRLSVSRGRGGISERDRDQASYLIESWPAMPAVNAWNENGLTIGVYPHARKGIDSFSHLKSANFLIYSMGSRYAKERQWNDCLILNAQEKLADSTIANVFMVREGRLFTPALNQGGVAGVMRAYLLEMLREAGYVVTEGQFSMEDVASADEIFLTNAVYGMRWVKQLGTRFYNCQETMKIYEKYVKTIWS